jgi:hypothetical protein
VISNPEVNKRLQKCICTRFSLGDKKKFAGKYRMPGTGGYALLDPDGNYIEELHHLSGPFKEFRQPGAAALAKALDDVLAKYPGKKDKMDFLKIYWLRYQRSYGIDYNADAFALSQWDRKPIFFLLADDPLPEELTKVFADPVFLERHYRSFVWLRGRYHGGEALDAKRREALQQGSPAAAELLKNGDRPCIFFLYTHGPTRRLGQPFVLADGWKREDLEKVMDQTWAEYVKVRPDVSERYKGLSSFEDLPPFYRREHEELRKLLQAGTLSPPGRPSSPTRKSAP